MLNIKACMSLPIRESIHSVSFLIQCNVHHFQEELAEMIQEVDRTGDGSGITEADFMRVMRKCGLC